MRCIAYARVSSREQSNNSNALNQQIERLKAAGAEKVFVDIESGYKSKQRPQLEKVMELVRSRQVQEVVITRIDRLSRKNKQLAGLFEEFVQLGVGLRVLDEAIDLSTAAGRMAANILAAFAQHHSDQKSEAVRHGLKHLRNLKKAVQPPFGYCVVNDGYQFDSTPFLCLITTREVKSRLDIAKHIIDVFFEQQTLHKTLREINSYYGIQSFGHFQKRGGLLARKIFRFSVAGLSNWLTNPVLQGHTCYFRKKNDLDKSKWQIHYDTHTDILITQYQAREIDRILAFNREKRGYGCKGRRYPLSELVFCGECHSRCAPAKANKGKRSSEFNYYYQCQNWRYRRCNQNRMIRMETIEELLISSLVEKYESIANYANTEITAPEPPELQEMRRKLEALSQLGFDPDIEQAKVNLARRIEEYAVISHQQQQEVNSRLDLLKSFSDFLYWRTLSDDKKREVYRALVERIVVRDGVVTEIALKI
jgi:DNA invertase Pin-like site-specific DNA recombinase